MLLLRFWLELDNKAFKVIGEACAGHQLHVRMCLKIALGMSQLFFSRIFEGLLQSNKEFKDAKCHLLHQLHYNFGMILKQFEFPASKKHANLNLPPMKCLLI